MFEQLYQRWKIRTSQCASKRLGQSFEYIQTAIIKTCAYNNRSALKLAFGKEYDKLHPGSIYSPPSYNENFSSAER